MRLSSLKKSVAIIFLGVALTACSGTKTESKWGTFQEPVATTKLPKLKANPQLKLAWDERPGRGVDNAYALIAPVLGEEAVTIIDQRGTVSQLNLDNGKRNWRRKTKHEVFSGVASDGDIVVYSTDAGNIVALDYATGEQRWVSELKRQISAIPAIANGRVVVRANGGYLFGLATDTGEIKWQLQKPLTGLSIHGDATPSISGDIAMIGFANGKLLAVNTINGRIYWESIISVPRGSNELERINDADSAPLITDTTVYSATYQGNVVATLIRNAEKRWTSAVSTRRNMYLSDGKLLITNDLGSVLALDEDSGDILWQQDLLQGRGISNPIAIGDFVYVADADGYLYSLAAENGELRHRNRPSSGATLSLERSRNGLLLSSERGELVSVNVKQPDA